MYLFIYFNGIVTGISTHGSSMTFCPNVSGWVLPFLQIINRATGQSCCCPAFCQQIFLKCKSLSPLAVPRTIFLLSVHVQTWRKPAGLSQITVPSQRATGAFDPPSNLCQARKEKKRKAKKGWKKVSLVHFNGLQRFWLKKKTSSVSPVIFNTALWGERLVMERSSVGNVPAISGSARSFVLKVELHSGRFIPSLCLTLMHFLV